ncbi:sn-glycerol-3-phosphate transport system permease protein UgpE [Allostella sp. ATCC 35155]|nr:sn-glycerol-3-phosphate transport system permease protein UgpE [Stella sp. ATCC 35155]
MSRRPWFEALRLVLLGLAAAAFLLPLLWMLSFSIKPADEIFTGRLDLLPSSLEGLANYARAMELRPLDRYLLNGVIVCGAILVFQILFAAPCAYALAKLRFPGRSLAFGLVLFALLVPIQVTAIPIFLMASGAGLLDSYTALVAPFTASAFAVFLFRQFYRTIPDDLIHAARVDGCSELSIVWRIIVPLTLPAATAFAIFSVVAHWNDLFWPLIVIRSAEMNTPPLGVMAFRSGEAGDRYGELMAGSVIITAPLVLAFLFAQRKFIEGISLGAVKG